MDKKTKVYFHGELIIVERPAPFAGVRKLEVSEDLKLADSETTGNHHMLKIVPGVHVFQDLDDMDRFFVRPKIETKIYCALESRHTDLALKPGCEYEIFPAQEQDHITRSARKVLD